MDSLRSSEKVTGALMIALVPAFLATAGLTIGVFDSYGKSPHEVVQTAQDNQRLLELLTGLALVTSALFVALAAMTFVVFRHHGHALPALGAVGFLMAGLPFLGLGTAQMAVTAIAREFQEASGARADGLAGSALAAARLGEAGLTLPLTTFLLVFLLAFGALIVRSGAMSPALGWLAIAGGALLPLGFALTVTIGGLGAPVVAAAYAALLLWLLLTGGQLLRRGTRRPAGVGA